MKAIDKNAFFVHVGYEPHRLQWLFHSSEARFRVPVCGRRFGKSRMSAMDEAPGLMAPKRRGWIVGPTYDLAEKEFRVLWDLFILQLRFGQNKKVKKAYNKRSGEMYIEFPWGTRVECRSADHPENLVGEKLDFAIMSEAAKHKKDTWERFIRPALADNRGNASFPTTPEGYNWLHGLWQLGRDPSEPDFESWQFPSWTNPYVYPDGREDSEIKLVERTTAHEWFLQEYGADFSAFVGKIYGEFTEATHVTEVKFNPEWPSYVGYDPGYTNPWAWVFFQIDPQDNVYVWKEHYKPYLQLAEHIAILRNMSKPEGYHLDMAFGDAADPEACASINTNFVAAYAEPEAKKNWREGVDLVKSYLKLQDVYSPGGGLVVVREQAKKHDDHALDALRYGLMHIFKLGCNSRLSDLYTGTAEVDADRSYLLGPDGESTFFNMEDLEF